MKPTLWIIAFLAFTTVATAQESGYTLLTDGKATWESPYASLNVSQFSVSTPQTIDGERYYVQLVNLSWKAPSSTVDIIFRFPRAVSGGIDVANGFTTYEVTVPNCSSPFDEFNNTELVCDPYNITVTDYNWNDITSQVQHREHNGQHYYGFENVNLPQGAHRMARLRFPVSSLQQGESIKWDFGVKLSSDTISEALASGRYILLDPVITGNFTDDFEDNVINTTLWKTYQSAGNAIVVEQNGVINITGLLGGSSQTARLWLNEQFTANKNLSFTIAQSYKLDSDSSIPLIGIFTEANESATQQVLYQLSAVGANCQGCIFYVNRSIDGNISIFNASNNNQLGSYIVPFNYTRIGFSVGADDLTDESRLWLEDFTIHRSDPSGISPEIYQCTASNGDAVISFNIYSENAPTERLTSGVQAVIEVLNASNRQAYKQFNYSLSGANNYTFCMVAGSDIEVDAEFSYNVTNGFSHGYYLINESLSIGLPLTINAYNYADTTGVSDLRGTVRESSTFNQVPKVYVALQRKYLSDGSWRTVQMDKTGDFGNFFFNIREEDTRYRFIFYNENASIIKSTDDMSFSCESGVCDLTFLIESTDASTARDFADFSVSFNNDTRVVTLEWDDPEQETDSVTLVVTKETFSQSILICSTSSTQQSGTLTCNASAYAPPYYVAARREANTVIQEFNDIVGQASKELRDLIGNSTATAFYGFIIVVITGTAALAAGPVVAGFALMAGIFALFLMGMFNFLTVTIVLMLGIGTAFIVEKMQSK